MQYSNFTLAEVVNTVKTACLEVASEKEVKEVLKYSLLQVFLVGYLEHIKVIKVETAVFDAASDAFLQQTKLSNQQWCCYLLLLIDNTMVERKIPAADFSGFLTSNVTEFARIQFKRPAGSPEGTKSSEPSKPKEVETVNMVFNLPPPTEVDDLWTWDTLIADNKTKPHADFAIGHVFYDEKLKTGFDDYTVRYQIVNSEAGVVGVVSVYFQGTICNAVTNYRLNQPVIIAKDPTDNVRFHITVTY